MAPAVSFSTMFAATAFDFKALNFSASSLKAFFCAAVNAPHAFPTPYLVKNQA